MPHIIVEHSVDILSVDVNNFLPQIQKTVASVKEGNFDLEACKARAVSFDKYFVGSSSQENSSFFHVTIKILAGRAQDVKVKLAQEIAKTAQEFLKEKNLKSRTDLSVDIVDMDRESYQKISLKK